MTLEDLARRNPEAAEAARKFPESPCCGEDEAAGKAGKIARKERRS